MEKSQIANHKSQIRKGFSLIELIFAVILLTIVVFGIVKLQTSTLSLSNTQNNDVEAYFLANQGAEIVKGIGYTYISGGSGPCPVASASCTCKITNASGYDLDCLSGDSENLDPFERTVEIDADGLTNAYKVTVIVEWEDSTGKHFKRDIDGDGQPDNAHAEAKRIIY